MAQDKYRIVVVVDVETFDMPTAVQAVTQKLQGVTNMGYRMEHKIVQCLYIDPDPVDLSELMTGPLIKD